MDAGKLDRRIILKHRTRTQNDNGEMTFVYTTFASVWAMVRDAMGAKRTDDADAESWQGAKTFTIRYRTDLKLEDVISFSGEQYRIVDISEVQRRQGLRIDAQLLGTDNQ